MSGLLPEHVEHLWKAYERAEGREHRAVVLAKLRAFVAAFPVVPADDGREWVRSFCRAGVDRQGRGASRGVVIRQPLFDGVLLPVLAALFQAGDPEAALWLASLVDSNLARDRDGTARILGLPSLSRIAVLRESLRTNPDHEDLRVGLMTELARWFDFALHELPAGVLYGMNGATPDECDELLAAVEEFRRLAPQKALVRPEETDWWEYHFGTYRDYLRDSRGAAAYVDYLERFAEPPPRPRFETDRR